MDAAVNIPGPNAAVWKNECVKCFHNARHAQGLNVCLKCFTAGCDIHAKAHAASFGHPVCVNIREIAEIPAPTEEKNGDEQPPQKLTKLAIGVEGGAQFGDGLKWRTETAVRSWPAGEVVASPGEKVGAAVAALLAATDTGVKQEAKAWEKRIHPCEHTLTLQQDAAAFNRGVAATCSQCSLSKPLWMCLTCGNMGCGRPQPPPIVGGNGHAMDHRAAFPDHVLVAKMGTITADGKGDVYCYKCDDEVTDETLADHLTFLGLSVANAQKTEMTMTELELERNKLLDLLSTEDGSKLEKAHGPGFTGLRNIGNTCYMNSVLQTFFLLPEFGALFFHDLWKNHLPNCRDAQPARCWLCQSAKLAHGLLSGDYSFRPDSEAAALGGGGVAPRMWKQLVTANSLFEGVEQQDSYEFVQFFVRKLTEFARRHGHADLARHFQFDLTGRVECLRCKGCRYNKEVGTSEISLGIPLEVADPPVAPGTKDESAEDRMRRQHRSQVPFEACLRLFEEPMVTDGFQCPNCKDRTAVEKRSTFASFPDYLVVQLRRFTLENWVPNKLSVRVSGLDNVNGQPAVIDLSRLQTPPKAAGEKELVEPGANKPVVDAAIVSQLEAMGFPRMSCERAAFETKNAGAEEAMNWLMEHMDDPLLAVPVAAPAAAAPAPTAKGPSPSPELIGELLAMGFTEAQAKHALRECANNMERAVDWLFSHPEAGLDVVEEVPKQVVPSAAPEGPRDDSPKRYQLHAFILHKGNQIGSGHYVVYIWNNERKHWILYDDERVFVSEKPPIDQAYLYLFRRLK